MDNITVTEILENMTQNICFNFCKYQGTENDDAECEWVRSGNKCPLDDI